MAAFFEPQPRNHPEEITRACLWYIDRRIQLNDFLKLFIDLLKAQQAREGTPGPIDPYSKHPNEMTFLNEVRLVRAVELFEIYISHILALIFEARPELLKSEGTIKVSRVVELGDFDEIIADITERKINELSYQPLSELRQYISSRTSIELFPDENLFDTTLLATQIRNVIAHNERRVNELFRQRAGSRVERLTLSATGKVQIDEDMLRALSHTLDRIVFDFDEAASSKFGIYKANPMTTIYMRD